MSRSSVCKVKLLLAAILSLSITSIFAAPPEWVEGQLIVKPRAGLSDARLEKVLGQSKSQTVKHLKQINARVIKVAPQAMDAVMRALSNNPHIDYVNKNPLVPPSAFTPNDPSYPDQWHLSKIQAATAWDISTGNGVTIAVLDAGVEGSHPDLSGSMVPGRNVVSNNSDTSPIGLHGTAVAGAVAATGNNGTGVASVAWRARIMPIRITNRTDGWASGSDMIEGILWAADHGARVVNISYDIGVANSAINEAAQYLRSKGGLLVMSAGNSNTNNGSSENPYIINVAATTATDAKASFSNYGNYIDVSAPGEHVVTTWENGEYGWGGGTSFSSPLAAGVIALIKAANSNLSVDEVEAVLKNSADDLGSNGWDRYFGHGRVNAAVAVQMATQAAPADTQAPAVTITAPGYNYTVSGSVLVDVAASDDTGVSRVELYANGQSIGSDSTAPYRFSWDSSLVADGNATLTAYAYDAANNTGISPGVTVTVDNQLATVDTTAPTVSITSPTAGSSISGTVRVSVNASDDTGVQYVTLYANGQLAGTDSAAPHEFNWDSTRVADGDVRFVAYAYDAANNRRTSSSVTVVVNNQSEVLDTTAPSVSITSPTAGSSISGTIRVSVNASDDTGVQYVTLYANGQLAGSDSTAPYEFNWDSTRVTDGDVRFVAYAYDVANNRRTSSSVTVTVDNQPEVVDNTAPAVAISSPVHGSAVSGTVSIYASASDNVGVTQLSVYVDNRLKCSSANTSSISCSWNTRKLSGSHTITAVARDAAGNSRQTSASVTVAKARGRGR